MKGKAISLTTAFLLLASVFTASFAASQEQTVSGTATVSAVPYPPEVQLVVPTDTTWTPYAWTTVTVTVRDEDMNLQNIYLMAYEGSLDNTASDDARNHYTWVASKTEAGWSFSCPLDGAYIDTTGCSVTEDSNAKTYTAVFKVRVAKTAAPGTWDLYARGVDSQNADSYLENAGAVTVAVYLELSLDDTTATFSGAQGQTVGASENPTVATVTANTNFNIDVKGAGNWSGPGTLSLSTTKADQDGSAPYDLSLSTSWQSLWSGVGYGEGVTRNIYWFLEIPVDATPGNYTNTLYVRVST